MRKLLLPTGILTVLLVVLLLSSSSLAAEPEIWLTQFTYDVPDMTWDEGPHDYVYKFSWSEPTPEPSESEGQFTVSSAAPLYQGFALIRLTNVWAHVSSLQGALCELIDEFHPDQPARFHVGYLNDEPMTYLEARAFFESMTVTVSWDGGEPFQMVRHQITPFPAGKSWERIKCSWTVRQ